MARELRNLSAGTRVSIANGRQSDEMGIAEGRKLPGGNTDGK